MKNYKIGLLPLYLKLYDEIIPGSRDNHIGFVKAITDEFIKSDVEVVNAEICCVENEFDKAIKLFEKENVDVIVTLHLTYSPSLESAKIISETDLPIVILDTTTDYSLRPGEINDDFIMMNHGIHGVQDLCNLLLRHNKSFQIEAGHWKNSDVIQRVISDVKVARMVKFMKNSRVGIIGKQFEGMGDFQVPFDLLKQAIGIEILQVGSDVVGKLIKEVSDEEIDKEISVDKEEYSFGKIDDKVLRENIKTGLGIRKWIEKEKLSSFSINFNDINPEAGLLTMPFLEASKAMTKGIGYAGEGDPLTAALTAALLSEFPETSFTEIFCPGWEDGIIFLSHMGEMNINLTQEKARIIEKKLPFIKGCNPVIGVGTFKEGEAIIVNLAPMADNKYKLIIAPVEVINSRVDYKELDSIQGWIKPKIPMNNFLKKYSENGGTHHSAMVYTNEIEKIEKFGKLMNFDVVKI